MSKKVYKSIKKYACPYCDAKLNRMDLISHVENKHEALIPEDYSATRVVYESINKTNHGICMICKKPVYDWNEKLSRYNNLCGSDKCRAEVRRIALERHIKTYNTPTLLNDPEHQEKMLANRKISGKYKHSDGGEFTYTGKFEKAAIEFMDKVMNIPSKDIQMPGPILEYNFRGEKHSWITDIYYIPANLIIEVKDGGDNPNNRSMPEYRAKQVAKEQMVTELGTFNYLRLTNNNFAQLLEVLAEIKYENMDQNEAPKVVLNINESLIIELATSKRTVLKDKNKLFHISENSDIKMLNPRIPTNFLIDKGYEDGKTSRICFATSIDGCLRAMSANLKGKTFYIYNPDQDQTIYIPTKDEVPDCKITGEVWVKNPVNLVCIGSIKVEEAKEKGLPYKYGKNTAELYDWNWHWIEKNISLTETKSELDDLFEKKEKLNLSSFKKIRITKEVIEKYKKEYPVLKHVRCDDTDNYICDGYMWLDNQDNLVCHVGSCEYLDDHTKWIVSLEIFPEYKSHGLSKQILDFAVKSMGCKYLSVNKNNKVAKYVYDSYGFKRYQSSDNMYYMTVDKHPVTEASISAISSPKNLSSWMKKNIEYKHTGTFLSPEEVLKNEYGDCHDQAYFEAVMLGKMGYRTGRIFMVEYSKWNTPGGATHTICYYIGHNKYFWFENAWGNKAGIHGPYETITELKKDIANNWEWSGNNDKLYMSSIGNVYPGMSFEEYVLACTPEDEVKPFAIKGEKFKLTEEVGGIPPQRYCQPVIVPYLMGNTFTAGITDTEMDDIFVKDETGEFQKMPYPDFSNTHDDGILFIMNSQMPIHEAAEKHPETVLEFLEILMGRKLRTFEELFLDKSLKKYDKTTESVIPINLRMRGMLIENELAAGIRTHIGIDKPIKGAVMLGQNDKGYYVFTPSDYSLSSNYYDSPESIPQNIIDTMADLYDQHRKREGGSY